MYDYNKMEWLIEDNLDAYLDEASHLIATAFNDLFRQSMEELDIDIICRLMKRRFENMKEVIW